MKSLPIFVIAMLSLTMVLGATSCDPDDDPIKETIPGPGPTPNPEPNPNPQPPSTNNHMKITAGSTTFTATLEDNETVTTFKQLLPMTVDMSELNNNEKYCSLPNALTTNAYRPGTIQNGDIMLYGSNTLVLFYKTFSTSYSYTRIGKVDNPSGLQSALGGGSVKVKFEMVE